MRVGNVLAAGVIACSIVGVVGSAHAQMPGNAERGKIVFLQCHGCHSLEPGKNGIGPTLHGLFGRKAGSVPDFAYSPFMKRSGIVWSEAELKSYLPDPQTKVPGTKMTFLGLSDPQQIVDIIAYLKEATK